MSSREARQLRRQLVGLLDEPDRLPPDVDQHEIVSLVAGLTVAINGWLER